MACRNLSIDAKAKVRRGRKNSGAAPNLCCRVYRREKQGERSGSAARGERQGEKQFCRPRGKAGREAGLPPEGKGRERSGPAARGERQGEKRVCRPRGKAGGEERVCRPRGKAGGEERVCRPRGKTGGERSGSAARGERQGERSGPASEGAGLAFTASSRPSAFCRRQTRHRCPARPSAARACPAARCGHDP